MRRTSSISSSRSDTNEPLQNEESQNPHQAAPLPSPQEEMTTLFVKDVSGKNTISLTLPASTTISTLSTLLTLRTNIPTATLRLTHSGIHLSTPTQTLSSLPANPTLHISSPIPNSMAQSKKVRCSMKACKAPIQPIVGECSFCTGKFCGKHRLLEDHKCEGLEDCKKESHERNAERLIKERTVVVKV